MRVLQLGKFYPVKGGVEKVMYDLMLGLSGSGTDCDMLCAAYGEASGIRHLNPHAKIICCRTWFRFSSTMISPSLIYELRKRCSRYDVIHVHHPDPMACLALFLSGYRGKVILHWHSDIIKRRLLKVLYSGLQRWLLRRADRIIGTSPVYISSSRELHPFVSKAVCVPIGIRPVKACADGAVRIRSRWPGKKLVFSLGRLIHYKGQEYLVDAAGYLPDDYMVLIGGTGPLMKSLCRRIEREGLNGKVELLGYIPDKDIPAWYNACDVFCLSSIEKTEAFGIVQLEAMSCGKPVVATDIPESGVPWVNADGISGLDVEPCNAEELARAIMEIMSSEEVYRGFSERAKARFDSMFTEDRMITECRSLYEEMTAR